MINHTSSGYPNQNKQIASMFRNHHIYFMDHTDTQSGFHFLWLLYIVLTFFGIVFFLAFVCVIIHVHSKCKDQDRQPLIQDSELGVYVVSVEHENEAFQEPDSNDIK